MSSITLAVSRITRSTLSRPRWRLLFTPLPRVTSSLITARQKTMVRAESRTNTRASRPNPSSDDLLIHVEPRTEAIFRFNCFNVEDSHDPSVGLEYGELAIPGKMLKTEVFDPIIGACTQKRPLVRSVSS